MARSQQLRCAGICVAAYVYGSIPLIHLMARQLKVDLKRYGSGNVGASNLWQSGGKARGLIGWFFDASKGIVPILVARRAGCPETVCEIAGASGIAGQCWPMFLRFNGGRGISSFVGASFAVSPKVWVGAMLPVAGGFAYAVFTNKAEPGSKRQRTKAIPLGGITGVVAFPLICAVARRDAAVTGPTVLSMIIIARRMTAPLPDDRTHGPAVRPASLVYRILYDRNTNR